MVSLLKLKHSNEVDHLTPGPAASSAHGPFNLDEWIRLMVRWIVTDDQVRFGIHNIFSVLNFLGNQCCRK